MRPSSKAFEDMKQCMQTPVVSEETSSDDLSLQIVMEFVSKFKERVIEEGKKDLMSKITAKKLLKMKELE